MRLPEGVVDPHQEGPALTFPPADPGDPWKIAEVPQALPWPSPPFELPEPHEEVSTGPIAQLVELRLGQLSNRPRFQHPTRGFRPSPSSRALHYRLPLVLSPADKVTAGERLLQTANSPRRGTTRAWQCPGCSSGLQLQGLSRAAQDPEVVDLSAG